MTIVGMKGCLAPVGTMSAHRRWADVRRPAMPYDEALRAGHVRRCATGRRRFVDTEHGWAVGDRGIIWHTADGGRHWSLQSSGVDCRLSSVLFLDRKIGWAAGGLTQPYTHASVGVVLHTRDGGEHWTQ